MRIATIPVLVLALGIHWTLLQTAAWTGMFVRFSTQAPLREALLMTFDGKHPCQLCKLIQKAQETKHDQQQPNPISKIDFALVWQANDFNFDTNRKPIRSHDVSAVSRWQEPPKPRPRTLPWMPSHDCDSRS